jgi:hypothetical protein
MKTSDSIKELAPALVKAQADIKAAIKDATNPHFKSRYADLSSVIDACKPALNNRGIAFLQAVRSDERAGVVVETILLHTSGEWISEDLFLPVSKNDAQGVGSAITYGRRYGLQSMVGIPAEDDDGNAAVKSPAERVLVRKSDAMTFNVEALEALGPEEQAFLQAEAIKVIDAHENGQAADYVKSLKLDSEEKMALWSLLPSNVRAAIKKQPTNSELATQP